MARLILIALSIPLALVACAVGDNSELKDGLETEPEWDSGLADTGEDTDSEGDEVTWWSLDGVLMVVDGEVRVEGSALELGFWSADLELDCDMEIPVQHMEGSLPPRDVELVSWWEVTLDLGDAHCDAAWDHYGALFLGIGELDAQLRPAMEANDITVDTVYGLYVQEAGEMAAAPVYVFGVAGTTSNYDGEEAAVDSGPLPDGAYALRGLHYLPYTAPPEK